jgi:hypothetical protein
VSRPFSENGFRERPLCRLRSGGRFGTHSSNESFNPIYYGKLVFLAYFNACVCAVDIRDPFHPREAASFIPAVTADTDKRCIKVGGVEPVQGRDPDEQPRRRRPRLRLSGRAGEHGAPHRRADRRGARDRELSALKRRRAERYLSPSAGGRVAQNAVH